MSEFTQQARKQVAENREFVKARLDPLKEKLSAIYGDSATKNEFVLSREEITHICVALEHYANSILTAASEKERALDCGDEYGNLKSHSEKNILKGCISLLCRAGDQFRDYLDYIGVKEDEEEPLSISFNYFTIVNSLFLYTTHHSGGTSTAAKCRQLGVDSSERIDICAIDDDEEDV